MRIVLWGAGEFGKRILYRIPEWIVAVIDSNPEKIGKEIEGKPIINYDEYEDSYRELFILVTPIINSEIVSFLEERGNYRYFEAVDLPGEWFDYNERKEYWAYLNDLAKRPGNSLIYGCGFQAIYLSEIIRTHACGTVSLVANKSEKRERIEEIQKKICEVISLDEVESTKAEVLYVATGEDLADLKNVSIDIVETWDCSDLIKEYYRPNLLRFKDIHKGKRCFIVGNGPSLSVEDLNVLYKHDEICFGVNSIYDLYAKTRWRPNYYANGDLVGLTMGDGKEMYHADRYDAVFITDRMPIEFYGDAPYDIFHLQAEIPAKRMAKFSRNIEKKIYYGGTIIYALIQIAVYMGFSDIYLIGVDFTGGANAQKTFYLNHKGEYGDWWLINGIVYNAYLSAKKESEKGEFNIYNATRGGELEVFKRVDFDSLFSKT